MLVRGQELLLSTTKEERAKPLGVNKVRLLCFRGQAPVEKNIITSREARKLLEYSKGTGRDSKTPHLRPKRCSGGI